jgi:hypothetical protein
MDNQNTELFFYVGDILCFNDEDERSFKGKNKYAKVLKILDDTSTIAPYHDLVLVSNGKTANWYYASNLRCVAVADRTVEFKRWVDGNHYRKTQYKRSLTEMESVCIENDITMKWLDK